MSSLTSVVEPLAARVSSGALAINEAKRRVREAFLASPPRPLEAAEYLNRQMGRLSQDPLGTALHLELLQDSFDLLGLGEGAGAIFTANLGAALLVAGRPEDAESHLRYALERSPVSEVDARIGTSMNLAAALDALSRPLEAEDLVDRTLLHARKHNLQDRIVQLMLQKGSFLRRRGRRAEAVTCYESALELAQRTGDRVSESNLLGNLGNLLSELDRREEALALNERAIHLAGECGDARTLANKLARHGHLLAEVERHAEAVVAFGDAAQEYRTQRRFEEEYKCLAMMADLLEHAQRIEDAGGVLERLVDAARAGRDRLSLFLSLTRLASNQVLRSQFDTARKNCQEAQEISAELGSAPWLKLEILRAEWIEKVLSGGGLEAGIPRHGEFLVHALMSGDRSDLRIAALFADPELPLLQAAQDVIQGRMTLEQARISLVQEAIPSPGDSRLADLSFLLIDPAYPFPIYVLGSLLAARRSHLSDSLKLSWLYKMSRACIELGHYAEALQYCDEGGADAYLEGESRKHLMLAHNRGIALRGLKRFEESERVLELAIEGARGGADLSLLGNLLGSLGVTLTMHKRPDAARNFLQEAARVHELSGDEDGIIMSRTNLGEWYLHHGDCRQGLEILQSLLPHYEQRPPTPTQVNFYCNIGGCAVQLELYDEARHYLQNAIRLAERLGLTRTALDARFNLALSYAWGGQVGQALSIFEMLAELGPRNGMVPLALKALDQISELHLKNRADIHAAIQALSKAVEVARDAKNLESAFTFLLKLGALLSDNRKHRGALETAREALDVLVQLWRGDGQSAETDELEAIWRAVYRSLERKIDGGPAGTERELGDERAAFLEQLPRLLTWAESRHLGSYVQTFLSWFQLPSQPETAAGPAQTDRPALHEHLVQLLHIIAQADPTTYDGRMAPVHFVNAHPDLLLQESNRVLVDLMEESAGNEQAMATLRTCGALLNRCRSLGIPGVVAEVTGLSELPNGKVFVLHNDGHAIAIPYEEGPTFEAAVVLVERSLDGSARLSPEEQTVLYAPEVIALLRSWSEEALRRGALGVAALINAVIATPSIHKRFEAVTPALQPGETLDQVAHQVFDLLNFFHPQDVFAYLNAHPRLVSSEGIALIERMIDGAPNARVLAHLKFIRECLVYYQRMVSSDAGGQEAAAAMPAVVIDLLDLAAAVLSGDVTPALAARTLAQLSDEEAHLTINSLCHAPPEHSAFAPTTRFQATVFAWVLLDDRRLPDGAATPVTRLARIILEVGPVVAPEKAVRLLEDMALRVEALAGNKSLPFAEMLLMRGALLVDCGNLEAGRPILEAAFQACDTLGYFQGAKAALRALVVCHERRGHLEQAVPFLKLLSTHAEHFEEYADVASKRRRMGWLLCKSGRPDEALGHFQYAASVAREHDLKEEEAYAHNGISVCLRSLGQLERALEAIYESIRIFQSLGDQNGEAEVLCNQGNIERDLGRFDQSLLSFQRALEIGTGVHEGERAIWLGNIGTTLLAMGRYEEAQRRWLEALAVHRRVGDREHTAIWLMNLGHVYLKSDVERALEVSLEARALFEQLGLRVHWLRSLQLLAEIQGVRGDRRSQRDLLERALEGARSLQDARLEVTLLSSLASCLDAEGERSRALELWRATLPRLPGVERHLQADILADLAWATSDVAEGIRCARSAIAIVEQERDAIADPVARLTFFARYRRFFSRMVILLVRLGCYTEAFQYVERMKTRTLLDLMKRGHGEGERGADHAASAEALPVSAQPNASYDQRGASGGDMLTSLRSALPVMSALVEYVLTEQGMLVFIVPGKGLLVPPEAPLPTSLHVALPSGGDALPKLNTWIAEAQIHVLTLPEVTLSQVRAMLDAEATGWRVVYSKFRQGGVEAPSWEACADALDGLLRDAYVQLMEPVLKHLSAWLGLRELVFVPHLDLHFIPFAALWTERRHATSMEPFGRQYVVDTLQITVAPSVAMYIEARSRPALEARDLLAVVDPGGDLPYARIEGEEISRVSELNVTLLIGDGARLERLREACAGVAQLHFACHGAYGGHSPFASHLKLADGPLHTSDVHQKLPLRLGCNVVLSGCETGLPAPDDPMDEAISLPGSFLVAGAGSVIASLWAVNDLSTALLMSRFYTYLGEGGLPVSMALQQAQKWLKGLSNADIVAYSTDTLSLQHEAHAGQRLLKSAAGDLYWKFSSGEEAEFPFAHPIYWAPFVVVGDGHRRLPPNAGPAPQTYR